MNSIKESFKRGAGRLKWFAGLMGERIKAEFAIIKLLFKGEQLKDRRAELARTIGERAFELREHSDAFILKDPVVKKALQEMGELDEEIGDLMKRAAAIGNIEE